MRLLPDANLSPALVPVLVDAGFDALHVADLDLLRATDETIFARAATDGLIVVTADGDFATMRALRRTTAPSVVLLRHVTELPRAQHGALLIANLPAVADALERGAIVSLSPTRLAVRDCRSAADHIPGLTMTLIDAGSRRPTVSDASASARG